MWNNAWSKAALSGSRLSFPPLRWDWPSCCSWRRARCRPTTTSTLRHRMARSLGEVARPGAGVAVPVSVRAARAAARRVRADPAAAPDPASEESQEAPTAAAAARREPAARAVAAVEATQLEPAVPGWDQRRERVGRERPRRRGRSRRRLGGRCRDQRRQGRSGRFLGDRRHRIRRHRRDRDRRRRREQRPAGLSRARPSPV